jgi:uncharacterized protein involved in exopolysaccharide biosynthesis
MSISVMPSDARADAGATPPRNFLATLWYKRKSLARAALAAAILGIGLAYLMPRDWTASGSFVIQENKPDAAGSLAGLTSKFGIDLSSASGGYSPRFFAWLLETDQVLGTIADMRLKAPAVDAGRTVMEALQIKGNTPQLQRARAIRVLAERVVTALYDQRPEVTTFTVTTGDPQMSFQIASALFAELNRFATERHQSRASVERQFVTTRRAANLKELSAAEDALAGFVMRNRAYQQAPEQAVEFSRLSRKVGELQAVQSMLAETYEKARIEEVRDTPVLVSVNDLRVPMIPDRRSKIEWGIAGISLALFGIIAFVAIQRLVGLAPPASPADPHSFAEVWPTLKEEMKRPWRFLV